MTPQAPFDSREYWLARHERFAGSHEATGLLGSSEQANKVLYELRQRALAASLGPRHLAGLKVLDAGCGRGEFSGFYHQLGAEVYGCDLSPAAVAHCRRSGAGRFECGRIAEVALLFPGLRFDLIHCFDVLYHLVDDGEWQASLQALEAVSAPRAEWYITEIARPRGSARHVRARGRAAYDAELGRWGRGIAVERHLHWLPSVRPQWHARFPQFSLWLEPLGCWRPTRQLACSALWTVRRMNDRWK